MADERRTKLKEKTHLPNLELCAENDGSDTAKGSLSPVQNFLKRKEEVTQQDQQEFSSYLQEKRTRDQQQAEAASELPPRSRLNRRSLLKLAAGTAAAGRALRSAIR